MQHCQKELDLPTHSIRTRCFENMGDEDPTSHAAPKHDKRFRNKVIVITGAGGTFGKVGCLFFALRGAKVGKSLLFPCDDLDAYSLN